jgi:hypothetical protein
MIVEHLSARVLPLSQWGQSATELPTDCALTAGQNAVWAARDKLLRISALKPEQAELLFICSLQTSYIKATYAALQRVP